MFKMTHRMNTFDWGELTELHVHVGSAVDPAIMWEIAHDQGIKLPTRNYWDFERLITVSGKTTYQKYLDLFAWTELIQSSPEAIDKSVYSIASGAYRKSGLGVTIHTGEATGADEVRKVVELLSPDRIGHGVRSTEDDSLLDILRERGTVLEICPSSNIHTGVVSDLVKFREIFLRLKKHRVLFTVNTDGPEMLMTNLKNEYQLLEKNNILSREDLLSATKVAKKASFIKNG